MLHTKMIGVKIVITSSLVSGIESVNNESQHIDRLQGHQPNHANGGFIDKNKITFSDHFSFLDHF